MSAAKSKKIREALQQLDPTNDEHWTDDGLPRMEAVEKLVGTSKVDRPDVTAAAPTFTRDNPSFTAPGSEEQKAATEEGSTPAEAESSTSELETELSEAEQALAEAEAKAASAKQAVLEAQRKRDEIIEAEARNQPVHRNQLAIKDYLDSQQRLREERAARMTQLKEAGIDGKTLSLLQGKSQIDAAMARKRGYGQERPNRPAPKQDD